MRSLFSVHGIYLPDDGAATGLSVSVPISDNERTAIEEARAAKLAELGDRALGHRASKYRPKAPGERLNSALRRALRRPGPVVRVGTLVDCP